MNYYSIPCRKLLIFFLANLPLVLTLKTAENIEDVDRQKQIVIKTQDEHMEIRKIVRQKY